MPAALKGRCTCQSIMPGITVRPAASITSAPRGTSPLALTETMALPSITIVASRRGSPPLPSISVPARTTVVIARLRWLCRGRHCSLAWWLARDRADRPPDRPRRAACRRGTAMRERRRRLMHAARRDDRGPGGAHLGPLAAAVCHRRGSGLRVHLALGPLPVAVGPGARLAGDLDGADADGCGDDPAALRPAGLPNDLPPSLTPGAHGDRGGQAQRRAAGARR